MPRPYNPHIAQLPDRAGQTPWVCAVCGETISIPVGTPLIAVATAVGVFAAAHPHPEAARRSWWQRISSLFS